LKYGAGRQIGGPAKACVRPRATESKGLFLEYQVLPELRQFPRQRTATYWVGEAMKFFEIIDQIKAKAKEDRTFAYKMSWGAAVTGVMTGCIIEIIKHLIW